MANKKDRLTENIFGRFYVDTSCIDCGLCPQTAPDFFRRKDDIGFSTVYRQPTTPEEIQSVQEALEGCPTQSIGDDGLDETPDESSASAVKSPAA